MQVINHDITKLEALGKINVISFLTHLQYMKQKNEIEQFEASIRQ